MDFEKQTDHQILIKRPNLVLIKKEKKLLIAWIFPFQQIIARKWKKAKRYANIWTLREKFLKISVEDEVDSDAKWNWSLLKGS